MCAICAQQVYMLCLLATSSTVSTEPNHMRTMPQVAGKAWLNGADPVARHAAAHLQSPDSVFATCLLNLVSCRCRC